MNAILLIAILNILTASFMQARFSAPNNVDSLEYHLPRQVFWMQHASVEHYPTSNLRQLVMPPLAEYAGLHLMLLTGNDHLHNLVQWLAFLLCMFAASLITRKYNTGAYTTTAQLFAALVVATIPIAFLQASNTKNDLVVALGVSLLAYLILPLFDPTPSRWTHIALIGLACGELVLTKGTAFIFGLPLGALLIALLFLRHRKQALWALPLLAALILTLNAPFLYRNYKAFGSPVPDDPRIHGGQTLTLDDHSPRALLSNIIRNLGPHFITPSTTWNLHLTELVRAVHQSLNININDPKTTWLGSALDAFRDYDFRTQSAEDRAAEPAQMAILLLLPIAIIMGRRKLPIYPFVALLGIVLVQFLLFCFVLKWQYWHVRLIIAMPVLLAPIFAWAWTTSRTVYVLPLIAAALIAGLLPSINCTMRPLWGSNSILHANYDSTRHNDWPNLVKNTNPIIEKIISLHAKVIAFDTGMGPRDYLIQRPLLDRLSSPPLFTAFDPIFDIIDYPRPVPDVVLTYGKSPPYLDDPATHLRYILLILPKARINPYSLYIRHSDQ